MKATATKRECESLARTAFGSSASVSIERKGGTAWQAAVRDHSLGVTEPGHWRATTRGDHKSPARAYGELAGELRGRSSKLEPRTEPSEVARGCLRAAIEHLQFFRTCPFCTAGQPDEDGGDQEHGEECPLFGYDATGDVESPMVWASSPQISEVR